MSAVILIRLVDFATLQSLMNSLTTEIKNEQLRLIYRQGPVLALGATLIALVLVRILWLQVDQQRLLAWLLLIVSSAVTRMIAFQCYSRRDQCLTDFRHWARVFSVGTCIAGCAWGCLPLLFYSELQPVYLLLITTVFAGMVSVTSAAGNTYMPTFYAFSLPMVLPLIVLHLFSANDALVLTGIMLVMYVIINSLLALRGHRQYLELITSRFEKAALTERLDEEKFIAEQAVIIKDQFLAAASHDLRQPLHAMNMFVGSLRKRDTNPVRLNIIDDMQTATTALSQLLHGMLDISKLEAGAVDVDLRATELNPLLMRLLAEFAPQAQIKGLSLQIAQTSKVLFTDGLLLERVLRNLLANAVRYTAAGTVSLKVFTDSKDCCEISVSDTGPGIPVGEHEAIFSEYYRLPGSLDSGGLGLGLSIVSRFCVLLNIKLSLKSAPGEGSTFSLSVATTEAEAAIVRTPDNTHPLRDRVVVLVEDEKFVRDAMAGMLEDWGCTVVSAGSTREALYQIAMLDRPPDVLLCDYRLANAESGLDAVMALREATGSQIPAIIVTGETATSRLREVVDSGLCLLHKPVDVMELEQAVSQILISQQTPPVSG